MHKNVKTKKKIQHKANYQNAKSSTNNSVGKTTVNNRKHKAPTTTTNLAKSDSTGNREFVQKEYKKASKNEKPHGSKRTPTYAEAVTMGEKKRVNKPHPDNLLTKTLMELTKVLQVIQRTGDLSGFSTKESGNNRKKSQSRFKGVRRP